MTQEWFYRLALLKLPQIGPVTARQLLRFGSPEEIFSMKGSKLKGIEGIGETLSRLILKNRETALKEAEKEIETLQAKPQIKMLWHESEDFPYRLKSCYDTPLLLYYIGNADLNADKIISIIGTRKASSHGIAFCEEFVKAMAEIDVLVISGLAYGIDACAHTKTLQSGLKTVGVLGHGLDSIYPAIHRNLAKKMVDNGGLLTEFPLGTFADGVNFPMRNRIVAGLCDALIVIESDVKGGSMITAEIGDSYGRELFAVPGRPGDKASKGCNLLIKTQRAKLLETPTDFLKVMNWMEKTRDDSVQMKLFDDLSPQGAVIVENLKKGSLSIDDLTRHTNIAQGVLATQLLDLELRGVIKSLPGKRYILSYY